MNLSVGDYVRNKTTFRKYVVVLIMKGKPHKYEWILRFGVPTLIFSVIVKTQKFFFQI